MTERKNSLSEVLIGPFREWGKDNASTLAAAFAYYAVMSLVPLLLIVVIIASYFLKTNTAIDQLTSQIGRFSSPEIASFIKSLIAHTNNTSHGFVASIISIITLILGASGVFSQLQSSLNKIWNVPPKSQAGIKKSLKNHLVSFLMVIAIGFLFLVFLAIDAVVSILIANIPAGSQSRTIAVAANSVVLFLLLTVMIAFIFRAVPDKEITWGDVWLGAAVTAILFLVGRYLIGFYLSFNKTASGYGAAGSLIVLLIWIYYSAQIFFFGAEFTKVYARTVGSHKAVEEKEVPQKEEEKVAIS